MSSTPDRTKVGRAGLIKEHGCSLELGIDPGVKEDVL